MRPPCALTQPSISSGSAPARSTHSRETVTQPGGVVEERPPRQLLSVSMISTSSTRPSLDGAAAHPPTRQPGGHQNLAGDQDNHVDADGPGPARQPFRDDKAGVVA